MELEVQSTAAGHHREWKEVRSTGQMTHPGGALVEKTRCALKLIGIKWNSF